MPSKDNALETRSSDRVPSNSNSHNHFQPLPDMKISILRIVDDDAKTVTSSPIQTIVPTTRQDNLYDTGCPDSAHLYQVDPNSIYEPPITSVMLKELDCEVLAASVQIRHDLILEPSIKLRPCKDRRASSAFKNNYVHYWECMEVELEQFLSHGSRPNRLLKSLEEMQKIVLACYPDSASVLENLPQIFDVELVQHQLLNKSFSLVPFMESLAFILKQNCAPRRDKLVDHLIELAKEGHYVTMIRNYFEILELMKLDVANYHLQQLRKMDPNKTIKMERDYFKREFEQNKLSIEKAKKWIFSIKNDTIPFNAFQTKSILTFMNFNAEFPETWNLDKNRIARLRGELQMCYIAISITSGLKQFLGNRISNEELEEIKARLLTVIPSKDTKLEDLTNSIVLIINRSAERHDVVHKIHDFVAKIICSDSPVYQTIQRRVEEIFVNGIMQDQPTINESIREKKMTLWLEELKPVYQKLREMMYYNWAVYHPIYEVILQNRNET